MFIATTSSPTQPPQVSLHKADGTRITWIEENAVDGDHPLAPFKADFAQPEFGSLKSPDGVTLYYSLLKPEAASAENPLPAIVQVYGGPGVQTVRKSWGSMIDQVLVQAGFVVLRLDNRGSAGRGKSFEDAIYRKMGTIEVQDQLVGVQHLQSLDFVDGSRIGINGWSYGGYMSLMAMMQAPETFAAGVSGAPVSDWSLYDTHYTERYMATPAGNPDGYKNSDVLSYAENLAGPLMIIHGMADDNVLFDHSTRVFDALQAKRKPFEMMAYPGEKHGIRGKDRNVHLYEMILGFFQRRLNEPSS